MYIVKETFIAKPGHAGELAQLMKKEMESWPDFKGRILLDAVTNYNTIVMEYELESLAMFDEMMEEENKKKAANKSKKPPKYTELYDTGKREIFRVV